MIPVSYTHLYASKERLRNYDNFKNNINRIFDDYKETYYIPAGRSMITLLVNNRSLIESENLDLITREFMRIIDGIHVAFADGIRNVHKRDVYKRQNIQNISRQSKILTTA